MFQVGYPIHALYNSTAEEQQRLKGAIDSLDVRFAEEQSRQRAAQPSPARSNSAAKRPPARSSSRSAPSGPADAGNGEPAAKGPDPKEFEPEFVIDDEDAASGSSTPRPPLQSTNQDGSSGRNGERLASDDVAPSSERDGKSLAPELSSDVRLRLRKLERLEAKYAELLRSYRIAHARVSAVEPFEAALRENTPLTSINDPGALVEYLNQLSLQGDMVLQELKRVSNDRTAIKDKLDEAEKNAREAWDEVARLKQEQTTLSSKSSEVPNTAHIGEAETQSVDAIGAQSPTAAAHAGSNGTNPSTESLQKQTTKSPPEASKPPIAPGLAGKISLPGLSIFSAKPKPAESSDLNEVAEDLFSFDSELPRLQSELQKSQQEVNELQTKVTSLVRDLADSTGCVDGLKTQLEESNRELCIFRERKDQLEVELKEQQGAAEAKLNGLRSDLEAADERWRQIETQQKGESTESESDRGRLLTEAYAELDILRSLNTENADAIALSTRLQSDLDAVAYSLSQEKAQGSKRVETMNNLIKTLREELSKAHADTQRLKSELDVTVETAGSLRLQVKDLEETQQRSSIVRAEAQHESDLDDAGAPDTKRPSSAGTSSAKKNKKRKKKGGKVAAEQEDTASHAGDEQPAESMSTTRAQITELHEQLDSVKTELHAREAVIDRLNIKVKDSEELREEIDSLRDDLITVGQEHVGAKDRIKELRAEKALLEATIADLKKDLADAQSSHASSAEGAEQTHKDLAAKFNDLEVRATNLQTDLSVAQQLASSRYKELMDLQAAMQKAQPEITSLRNDNRELRLIKDNLSGEVHSLREVAIKHDALQRDVAELRKTMTNKNNEIKSLNQRLGQESDARQTAEKGHDKTKQNLENVEKDRNQLSEALDQTSRELLKARENSNSLQVLLRETDQSLKRLEGEDAALKEELELKSAQYASAESLLSSMQSQTSEMATQLREARERCDSLEEEIADAHRLLSERGREAETMRRLLAEVETRSDSRIREMKERMQTAVEERDRIEDEASTAGRRRAREVEEMRNKLRDAERNLKRAEDEKEELESMQREWRKRRDDLENLSTSSAREAEEARKAMGSLRDALDESEKQARDLERQKAELRRSFEESQTQLDKMQKANKSMMDEVRSMQAARSKAALESKAQTPRTSFDMAPSRAKLASPAPTSRQNSTTSMDTSGQVAPSTEYLKTILLQFLEQKDRKHQMQLIPVLGTLLHFDRKDQEKWTAAIMAK